VTISAYLPQDRLRALARGESLPDHTVGSAMFADISGFTTLTEGLRQSLGARQGAEELSKQLGAVYSALIAEVEKYGGSVIGFAGDAITCWFDDANDPAAPRAVTCAFALQRAMRAFSSIVLPHGATTALALKVAVATGPARRFVVGQPTIHYVDALAGATVARTASAEHLAQIGDVLVDATTLNALGELMTVKEWRHDESGERFAVASELDCQSNLQPSMPATLRQPAAGELQAWIHNIVYERELSGQEAFQTEFRPCAALFVRFVGIDYDADDAQPQLDSFISQLQEVTTGYGGALLQLTIGDKGSYAYLIFGALSAHEDDARRAVKTALELRNKAKLQLQMGITQGVMRVGAYGGATRKTFGALGDDVNLAARLMMAASENEILLSNHVHEAVQNDFTFEPRPPLPMKGKAEPLPVFAVTGKSPKRAIRLQEPTYALPMVGRKEELQIINDTLDLAAKGQSQVIGIVAEAGLGKSRLVAEVIRSARRKGFVGYGGACQSDGIHTPYQAWKGIWQAFFDVNPEMPERKLIRWLEGEIEDRALFRVEAIPLLNAVLDLNLPENDFTRNLEPKIRQSALHALFEDCLKSAAKDEPLLIVIEDLHWIDALSHDLLEGLAKALAHHAACFVLAYRPPELERLHTPRLEALPQFTRIDLHELTHAEAESAIRAKLLQLYPARAGALPEGLVDALMARAQGNPFYLEELLNYVRDRGLDPSDLHSIELPDSLHTLILSRIDQLSEQEKTTLRVASIVGRLFRARWLTGYYPELGSFPQVKAALDALESLDITPLDTPEPELAYLFKHIITHEVTYESLPFATRAKLHEQLARYLENQIDVGATHASPLLETLAFHYGRSENKAKQMEYLRKAGEAAQKDFANEAALDFYGRLLPLLKDDREQVEIRLKRGEVLELMGNWEEAEGGYRAALEWGKDHTALKASAQFALGKLNRLRGEFETALEWLAKAKEACTALGDTAGLAQVLIESGMVWWWKSEFPQARQLLSQGLELAREAGDMLGTAHALHVLGIVVSTQADYPAARALNEESLAIRRKMGDKGSISDSLNNLGLLALAQGDYAAAQALLEESLTLDREMGDKLGVANSLLNVGRVAMAQGDTTAARAMFEEGLSLYCEMGHKTGIATSLGILGDVAYLQGEYATAAALQEECLVLCKEMNDKQSMAYALLSLGLVGLAENTPDARERILQSLRLRQESGEQLRQTSSLVGMAGLALQQGNARQAAQWLGAVESGLQALNAVLEPAMIHIHAQTLAAVKEKLGGPAFRSAWQEGSKWSLDQAVQRALQE
jgi:class 3 adenylate cyclase/tetratricopeptide (TPR) repeat protein